MLKDKHKLFGTKGIPMGWFSNPNCPRCGREASITSDGLTEWYTCHHCNRKAREEKERQDSLENRIAELEKKLKEKE